MAHTDKDQWNEAVPANSEGLYLGAQETRLLRAAVGSRLEKEHVKPAEEGAGGEHLPGSAKAYFGDFEEDGEPDVRPDETTVLDEDDAGRLAVDSETKELLVHDGTEWTSLSMGAVDQEGVVLGKFDGGAGAKVTTANTFEDVDSGLGRFAILFIQVKVVTASSTIIRLRPKGFGGAAFNNHQGKSSGLGELISSAESGNYPNYFYTMVATDSNGIFQIGANSATTIFELKLVGAVM